MTLGYKIKQEIKKNTWAKVTAILLLMIIIITVGILLIFLAEWYSSGCGLLTLSFYLLMKLIETETFMKKCLSAKWWNIIEITLLIIVVGIVMIILLIELDDKSQAALEVISYALYLLVFIFCILFYFEYTHNEKSSKNQIYVYSPQLFPMLKYESSQSKLTSNKKF